MSVPVLATMLLQAAAPLAPVPQGAAQPPSAPVSDPAQPVAGQVGAPPAEPAPVPAPPAPAESPLSGPAAAPSGEVAVVPPQDADTGADAANDIVVSARVSSPTDPLLKVNVEAYKAIQAVDDAVVAPMAKGYQKGVPSPIRSGLRNFLRNLDEPVSFVNYLLQLKPGRAVKSLGRFAINSTVGIAGLIDVAKKKPFNLPYRPNGFANTLACYGVGNGPYFFLPLAGPITLRDLIGIGLDKSLIPAFAGAPFSKPYYAVPAIVVDSLNDRIEQDAVLEKMREESGDPYTATRELYLKQRRAEIGAICPKHGDVTPDPALPPRVGKGEN